MGRTIEELPDGRYRIECVNAETCKNDYNDICCNDKSDYCSEWVDLDYCLKSCPYFEPEDMQEGEVLYEQVKSE